VAAGGASTVRRLGHGWEGLVATKDAVQEGQDKGAFYRAGGGRKRPVEG
jgi:hypothetical protein